ncbi:hypothetical protein FN976_14215 [Caenimonas sedimenti]|uniref:DUF1273 family protein n=1 Tax=Caenimonas sedimenti TaxID=2596921 RepID=A0A562ZQY5_9BURK|nr:hypothetical protein [Caenimonas sedimenti]TWO70705.1 hypothetical protein FN976_14215 [Caenimonas sedimenti]
MQDDPTPRKVFLFSGHMIDAPGRPKPRFPAACEPIAREAIQDILAQHGAGPDDVAISSGACGGDLLFAEAVLARGARLEIYLPFEPEEFARGSVDFAGEGWHARFEAACARADVHLMPRERPLAEGEDPYECVNLWMLEAAWRWGGGNVTFLCLWNGQGADGLGGTEDLMQKMRAKGGSSEWLDTRQLWQP